MEVLIQKISNGYIVTVAENGVMQEQEKAIHFVNIDAVLKYVDSVLSRRK